MLYLVTGTSYYYLEIILIPIYLYLSIGVFKGWPKVKSTYMIVILLLFVGTITQFIALLISNNLDLSNTWHTIRSFLGLTLPPVVYFTIRSKDVTKFLESAT